MNQLTNHGPILVPTDFSDISIRGVRYAKALAQAMGVRLDLIHIIDRIVRHAAYFVPTPTEEYFDEQMFVNAEVELKQLVRDHLGTDILIEPSVLVYPKPEVAIVERARTIGAQMIVMGTHGRDGLSHVILGSVTEKVIRLASCPVLVVGPHQVDLAPA